MPRSPSFLVIDYNSDNGALIARNLRRKFPHAIIHLCAATITAKDVQSEHPDVIIHHMDEFTGVQLISSIRAIDPETPIVAMSVRDTGKASIAAGASTFLLTENWLRVGDLVHKLLHPTVPQKGNRL